MEALKTKDATTEERSGHTATCRFTYAPVLPCSPLTGTTHVLKRLTDEVMMPLERIDDGDDLILRCTKCFENLDRCVKAAEIAEQVDYSFTKTILAPIRMQGALLESGCDSLNTSLYDLAKLQDSLRLALGVQGARPEAELYKNIKSVQAGFSQDDKDDIYDWWSWLEEDDTGEM